MCTYSPKLLRLLNELHVAGSRADYDHQGVEVVVAAINNAIPVKLLLPYLHGESPLLLSCDAKRHEPLDMS
jgi:hypothetical protein